MTNGFKTVRLGHAAVGHHHKRDECTTGGLYKSPTKGQVVDASQPVNISWDTSCLNTSAIDIYLYAPSAARPIIHGWSNVNYKAGSYSANIQPGWWNSTSSISLEFTIVPAGESLFGISTPAGPLFTATYNGTKSTAVAGAVEQVDNLPSNKHGLSKGAVAAAVLIPMLLLIGLGVAIYIKIARTKGKEKRKRFSQAVDKRMSTISTDWKSMTPAGANAAIRNSMAVSNESGNRLSSFSFGAIRPSSTVAVEGGQAGIGARGIYEPPSDAPQMSQLRPGIRASAFENRVSRVSFAADPRPSTESRRNRQSRAFHVGHVPVPPLPNLQNSTESSSNSSPILSPVQTAGPLTLTAEDIRARMGGQEAAPRPSVDEVMPALSMMRTGGEQDISNDELLFKPQVTMPAAPSPTHQAPKSPIMGVMPMQPMPANVMSPDDMLRAYAERRAMGGAASGVPSLPAPAANYNGTGMRTLYSPDITSPVAPIYPASVYPTTPANRKSRAPTEYSKYDEDDAYGGTAQ
ncbi:hypothetical protein BN946_scf184943.g35 [Trametes cinnabarina]|uniref:Uncharacterized protein n=1 Tax=Pycnoporus cinnabarinus TaxID=5643 RepID=A0A060SCA8_PYCCI|nr:hypothetical protein BN946_scf184943.g35 [Trametes cinnabarina]